MAKYARSQPIRTRYCLGVRKSARYGLGVSLSDKGRSGFQPVRTNVQAENPSNQDNVWAKN